MSKPYYIDKGKVLFRLTSFNRFNKFTIKNCEISIIDILIFSLSN